MLRNSNDADTSLEGSPYQAMDDGKKELDSKSQSIFEDEERGIHIGVADQQIQRLSLLVPEARRALEEKITHYSDLPFAFKANNFKLFTRYFALAGFLFGTASLIIYIIKGNESVAPGLGYAAIAFFLIAAGAKCFACCEKRSNHRYGIFDRNEEIASSLTSQEATKIQTVLDQAGLPEVKIDTVADGSAIRAASKALAFKQKEILHANRYNRKLNAALFKTLPQDMPSAVGQLIFDYAIKDPMIQPSM